MAWLGRESQREQQRAERVGAWLRARNTPALLSVPLGAIAVVDSLTMVLGLAASVAAVTLGIVGWRQTRPPWSHGGQPQPGRRLAVAGIVLGGLGIALSLLVAFLTHGAAG